MGIRGLKTFIENNSGLYVNDYHLHDTPVVIDANNLVPELFFRSQKHERRDLFGGDMVQYGRYLKSFFMNLKRCNIEPILVVDGAQTHDDNKSKTREKHRRSIKRFQKVMSITRLGFGDYILPALTTNVFRSIAVDLGLRIIQCMYEADAEVARISHELKCPVISNDSDFFLMDLPYGVIGIDLLQHENVMQCRDQKHGQVKYTYLECSLFKQENFVKYLPDLDIRSLPLMGVLAGNDFVSEGVFEQICERLPSRCIQRNSGRTQVRSFKKSKYKNKQHEKILKILFYVSNKSLNETVNQICLLVAKSRRQELKKLIKSNLLVYDVPIEDDFAKELDRLYWQGFMTTQRTALESNQDRIRELFEVVLEKLIGWLRQAMEHSVLSYRCLELANRNTLFIQGHMDDPTLASAHKCQMRPMQVMLALLRSHYDDVNSCEVYDRIGNKYDKQIVRPLDRLDKFGQLNYIFMDLPNLPPAIRRSILFATFHSTGEEFDKNISRYYLWLESRNADEFLTIKLLLNYVDIESTDAKLWSQFRQATQLCMLYHFYKDDKDEMLTAKLKEGAPDKTQSSLYIGAFMDTFTDMIKNLKLARMPRLEGKRKYNCRLMHQITQLQCSITSFNLLNAFLGDVATRLRTEGWLNSCLIYNLAEAMRLKTLRPTNLDRISLLNDGIFLRSTET